MPTLGYLEPQCKEAMECPEFGLVTEVVEPDHGREPRTGRLQKRVHSEGIKASNLILVSHGIA